MEANRGKLVAAAFALLLVVLFVWMAWSQRAEHVQVAPTSPAPQASTGLGVGQSPNSMVDERQRVVAHESESLRCVDYHTGMGIQGVVLSAEAGESWATDENGWAQAPDSDGWFAYSSGSHGDGRLQLQGRSGDDKRVFRLRRAVRVQFFLQCREGCSGPLDLRIDRAIHEFAYRDDEGIHQRTRAMFRLSEGVSQFHLLPIGLWSVSTTSDCSVSPFGFLVAGERTVTIEAALVGIDGLSGTLVDADGNPCPDVDVSFSLGAGKVATSDSSGRFVVREDLRSRPGGVVMLNIAQDSQAWQPKWSVGPFLKGQAGVVIELQPRRSTSVEVRVDDVAVERFKLGVLRDRWIRDESAGLPSVPATMVSYESDGGRVLIDGPLQANDIAKVSLEDPKSETWFRAENVHIDQSSGVRRCIFSLKTLNLAITVEDAITGIPIPGATIELLDSPGGVSHALIRASALQGALPTVSLARLTSDANGSAFTRIVTCKSPLYSVQAVGYADLLGAASSIVEPHLTLHPVARLRGTVAMPQSGSNWDARLKFTPTESHNFREVREVPVTKGSFVVDEIAYGDFAVELRTGPAEPLVAIDLGVLRYSGQDYEEFDAGSYHWTEVIFDTRGVQANLFDIMNVYARSTGWLLPVDVKDGLPQHLWLPQGRYFFAWQSQSIETAAPMLAHVAFDVLAGQKTLVVPVGFSGLPCQVEFRTDAGPLVNAWVCLPGYPYRRTDDNGYVFLEEPLQPGAKVWALTDQLLPAGGQVELHEMNMNGAQFLRADLGDLKPTGR